MYINSKYTKANGSLCTGESLDCADTEFGEGASSVPKMAQREVSWLIQPHTSPDPGILALFTQLTPL